MRILISIAFISCLLLSACKVPAYYSDSKPVQHQIWDSLLNQHVDEMGKVDYRGFQKDSLELKKYLAILSSAHPNEKHWSRDERLAYWLNAYNAFTVKLMIDHYPVASIKDIKNGIPFVNTVWDIKFIQIEEQLYDLNNIEHGIIRDRFNEPRIHFAANCASISCPRLRYEAYTADKLEDQLEDQTKFFINNRVKNKINSTEEAELSKLFSWYSGDFKKGNRSVIDFINGYSSIQLNKDANLTYLEYNWAAND